VSLGISVITIAVLVMTAESHQDCPMNYFLTWTFTLWTSFTFGSIASNPYFETSLQLIYYFDVTLIIVFALILSLILYALSPRDFNNQSCILYVVGIVVIFECIYFIFLPAFSEYLVPFLPSVVFAGVGGLFFSIVSQEMHVSFQETQSSPHSCDV
jgi:FtsH-binding integral membrane protein